MFASPSFRVFNQQGGENKDALMARKPGVFNSARKPLADKSVNESKLPKPDLLKSKSLKTANTSEKKVKSSTKKVSPKQEYPDLLMDICSFKPVEDTYEDILPKSQRLHEHNVTRLVQPKATPVKSTVEIDPMFFELPQGHFGQKIRDEVEEDVMEIPDFTFLTGISSMY